MAKVSELIEQARALEAQGEAAKALAIYEHVLPHVEGMPAIKADLALKSGDLMLKLGNRTGALAMYATAGTQCAMHGSTKGALTVASKIQQAAPERTDVYLSLAGEMVKHGHAGAAVDVLIQHAKNANLPNMLQELEPLSGRPSEDVRPIVEMLLEAPAPPPQAPGAPPAGPAPPPPPPPVAEAKAPPAPEPMRPMSLEEELAAHVPPPGPPVAPPPPPQFWPEPAPPPAPPYTPPPAPIAELPLDLSPPLPPSPRETKEINLRASQAMHREEVEELERPRPRVSRPRVSMPVAQPPRPPSAARAFLLILVLVVAALGALAYFGILPVGGWLDQVKSTISTRAATSSDGTAGRAGSAASPASPGAARGAPTEAPPPGPGAPRIAGARVPPVRIEGLPVESFTESGDRFRVLQRRPSGETLTLLGRPLADTIGEPSVGDIRLDSLPGDTAVATTAFGGYVITVRGVIAPADLQALLLQLVSRTN